MNWKENIVFPEDMDISNEAKDLISRWCCEPENRLGVNGIEEIQAHPFFRGINWEKIRTTVFLFPFSFLPLPLLSAN